MNKKIITTVIGGVLLCGYFGAAFAYTSQDSSVGDANVLGGGDVDTAPASTCIELKSDALRYRATDATTNGEVSVLQDFLVSTSLLKTSVTGYFGLGTMSAVKQFQRKARLSPTGYVGPLTKAKIKEVSCSGDVSFVVGQDQNKKFPSSSSSTLPPLPSQKERERMMNPPVYASSTSGCDAQVRFCPNGTPMARDPSSCVWMESKCGSFVPSTTTPSQGMFAAPPSFYGEGSMFPPRPTSTNQGVVCTMEVRFCSNGSVMARNMTTCEWLTSSCPQGSTGRVIVPEGTSGGGAPSVPAHGVERAVLPGGGGVTPVDVP